VKATVISLCLRIYLFAISSVNKLSSAVAGEDSCSSLEPIHPSFSFLMFHTMDHIPIM
jgi:hypothetical protein